MNLGLSDTQEMIRDSMRQQLQREMSTDRIRALLESGGHDEALWKRLAADGWLGFAFPESAGGGGADLLDIAVALEELSKAAATVPFAETMACAYTLMRCGTQDGQAALAAAIVENAGAVTPVLGEAGGEGPCSFSAGALHGSARYVDYGLACTHHLVGVSGCWPAAAVPGRRPDAAGDAAVAAQRRADAAVGGRLRGRARSGGRR